MIRTSKDFIDPKSFLRAGTLQQNKNNESQDNSQGSYIH